MDYAKQVCVVTVVAFPRMLQSMGVGVTALIVLATTIGLYWLGLAEQCFEITGGLNRRSKDIGDAIRQQQGIIGLG